MKSFYSIAVVSLALCGGHTCAQSFTRMSANALSMMEYGGNIQWADMNNDGKLDLVYMGYHYGTGTGVSIYTEENDDFKLDMISTAFGVTSYNFNHMDLGDYDGDGDLDIFIKRQNGSNAFRIIRNDGNFTFTDSGLELPYAGYGNIFCGDADNDGALDFLYSGPVSGIKFNSKQTFARDTLFSKYIPFQAWADVDADGDLDIVQTRRTSESYGSFIGNFLLLRNANGSYTERKIDQATLDLQAAEFADYDNDGDLDALLKTFDDNVQKYFLYTFNGSSLVLAGVTLPPASTAKWADFNNDGYADIIISWGQAGYGEFVTRIYYNDRQGGFTESGIREIQAYENDKISVGDFDNDGDTDVAVIGEEWEGIFKNNFIENGGHVNVSPTTPPQPNSTVNINAATFTWNASTDNETPAAGLTYNLKVRRDNGTLALPGDVKAGTTQHLFYDMGNVQLARTYRLGCLQEGNYFWSVQALDNSFQSSGFTSEKSFAIANVQPQAPTTLAVQAVSDRSIKLTWKDNASTESAYLIFRKLKDDVYNTEYQILDTVAANTTSYIDDVNYLAPDTWYVYKVIAYNCSYPNENYQEAEGFTFPPAFVPTPVIPFDHPKPVGWVAALADYDNDKDLDLMLSYGYDDIYGQARTALFKNDHGVYTDTGIEFPGVNTYNSSAQWIDYNRDGYQDIILVLGESFSFNIKLYLNDNEGGFVESTHALYFDFKTLSAPLTFADFDNDADLDVLVQGADNSYSQSLKLLINDGTNQFTNSSVSIDKSYRVMSNAPWGDFDNDGYVDLLVSKQGASCEANQMRILKNMQGKGLQETNLGIAEGLSDDWGGSDMQWTDYDNDGRLDFIITGTYTCSSGEAISHIYHQNGHNQFDLLNTPEVPSKTYDAHATWVDYNNDGSSDLLLYGDSFSSPPYDSHTEVYTNTGSTFVNSGIDYLIDSRQYGGTAVGDIDNDHDIDYIVMGEANYTTPQVVVYKNNHANAWNVSNNPPGAPTNLRSKPIGSGVTLTWDDAGDDKTPAAGLTYNVYFIQGADTLIVPSSHWNGYRKIVAAGNAGHSHTLTLQNIAPGNYSWSVQAIDNAYQGGPFAAKQVVVVSAAEHAPSPVAFFPNPVSAQGVNFKAATPVEISIFNSLGIEIARETISGEGTIATAQWPAGVYIVRYADHGEMHSEKLVRR
ncbi:MAG TPA: FG-GAP-like repeat-containing protein [Chryseolinea sp.]